MTHALPRLVPCSAHLAGGEGLEGHRQLGCGGQQVQTSLVSCEQLSRVRGCGAMQAAAGASCMPEEAAEGGCQTY